MKTNCLLLSFAVAFAFGALGAASGGSTVYDAPYTCYNYDTCFGTLPCAPTSSGTCGANKNPYNYMKTQGQYQGSCVKSDGDGCIYFNGNALCLINYYYNLPPGQTTCGSEFFQCSVPENMGSGCEGGPAE